MNDIFKTIDNIFSQDIPNEQEKPAWANEILSELKEIKQYIKESKKYSKNTYKTLKDFIKDFNADFKDKSFIYQGSEISANSKGYLYDISTNKNLPTIIAYDIYRKEYDKLH